MITQSIGFWLSWEYWRRGMYWFVPGCVLLVVGFMAPAYAVLSAEASVRAALNYAILAMVCWTPLVMALASRGLLRRQYTLPVGSGALAGWTLVNGALAVAITYWLVALSFNALFRAGWPIWGPAWWAVVIFVVFQATVWSVAGSRGALLLPVVVMMMLAVFSGPLSLHERVVPAASDSGSGMVYPTMSAAELAASLAVLAVFYVASVYVVGRDRRGEAWSFSWLSPSRWAERVRDSRSTAMAPPGQFVSRTFRSPRAAQFWTEWRSRGRYVPLAVAGAFGMLWIVAVLNGLDWYSVSGALGGISSSLLLISPFAGIFLGHRSDGFDIKPFLATRPLGDGEHAMLVLRIVAAAYGSAVLVWFGGFMVTVAVWGPSPSSWSLPPLSGWADVVRFLLGSLVAVVGILLLVWTLMALGASLAMARSWFVAVAGIGGGTSVLILINIAGQAPSLVAATATFLLSAGSAGGTAAAYAAAWRRELISERTLAGALVVYVLLLMCFVVAPFALELRGEVTLLGVLAALGVCAAPLAPLATGPLALAWNRHR